jgi:hypothetical protein
LSLGLSPDAPSVHGAINRVVKGVKIYNPDRTKVMTDFLDNVH